MEFPSLSGNLEEKSDAVAPRPRCVGMTPQRRRSRSLPAVTERLFCLKKASSWNTGSDLHCLLNFVPNMVVLSCRLHVVVIDSRVFDPLYIIVI